MIESQSNIICDSEELQEVIRRWSNQAKGEFKDFTNYLQVSAFELPIKLSNWNEKDCCFETFTSTQGTIKVWLDFDNQTVITEKKERRLISSYHSVDPRVNTTKEYFLQNGKHLECHYSDTHCYRLLSIDDIPRFIFMIDEPRPFNESEIAVLRNATKVEEYLLGLDNLLDFSKIYQKILELIEFSEEDIANCSNIFLSYSNETTNLGQIRQVYGKMEEYSVFDNGETFHVCKNGDWHFTSGNNIQLSFEDKRYHLEINGKQNILRFRPAKTIYHVKKKMAKLRKFLD